MLSSEYKSETESNIGSVLLIHQESLPTPLLFLLSPLSSISLSLPLPYNMSQHDLNAIIQQL